MSKPTPLIDAMTGETVGYEIRPGDDPIALGMCSVCGGAVTTWDDEIVMSRNEMAHPHCARFGMFPS